MVRTDIETLVAGRECIHNTTIAAGSGNFRRISSVFNVSHLRMKSPVSQRTEGEKNGSCNSHELSSQTEGLTVSA